MTAPKANGQHSGSARLRRMVFERLDRPAAEVKLTPMAVTKTKPKASARAARTHGQLDGHELAALLRKLDSAKSTEERKRWRREFMRGFYGDTRADGYA